MSPVLHCTQGAESELDVMFVVPSDIGIHLPHELLGCRIGPVAAVLHLIFQTSEGALTG